MLTSLSASNTIFQLEPSHSTMSFALAIKSVLSLFFQASAPSTFLVSPMSPSNSILGFPDNPKSCGFDFIGSIIKSILFLSPKLLDIIVSVGSVSSSQSIIASASSVGLIAMRPIISYAQSPRVSRIAVIPDSNVLGNAFKYSDHFHPPTYSSFNKFC